MNFILLKLHQAGSIHSSFGKGGDEGPEKLREISRCADNQNWEPGFLNFSSSNQKCFWDPKVEIARVLVRRLYRSLSLS